jgi:hypothetical protein
MPEDESVKASRIVETPHQRKQPLVAVVVLHRESAPARSQAAGALHMQVETPLAVTDVASIGEISLSDRTTPM